MMKRILVSSAIATVATLIMAGSVLAAANPQGTGQPGAPNETCGTGNATVMPNGFSTGGFATAGAVYAGSDGTPSQQNAQSTSAISQYDVACYQLTAK